MITCIGLGIFEIDRVRDHETTYEGAHIGGKVMISNYSLAPSSIGESCATMARLLLESKVGVYPYSGWSSIKVPMCILESRCSHPICVEDM